MEKVAVDQMSDRIFTLLGEQLGVRGKTLEARFRKAGRLVPKRARAPIRTLIEVQRMAQSPKLAMRIDPGSVSAAYDQAMTALNEVDRAADQSRKRFNIAALIALQLMIIGAGFFFLMRWRGYF